MENYPVIIHSNKTNKACWTTNNKGCGCQQGREMEETPGCDDNNVRCLPGLQQVRNLLAFPVGGTFFRKRH